MSKHPAPSPRTCFLAKQADVCSDDMPISQDRKPPPVPLKINKVVKCGGQPLPGMVRSSSVPDSDQHGGGAEVIVPRNIVQDRINFLQGINETTIQSSAQGSTMQREPHVTTTHSAQRNVLLTQQSWHGDFQKPLRSGAFYQRSNSIPVQSSVWPEQCTQDSDFMEWWRSKEPWKECDNLYTKKDDAKAFTEEVELVQKAFWVYDYLLSERGPTLQGHITELQEIAKSINKVYKGAKIAGITGGTAGAVGVAAVIGGVILAPLTMGASLAVAAVGVGVAAAGGVTGASAAITNKVYSNMDRKKVETIFKDYSTQIEEIERCVKFIGINVEHLKKYNLSTLCGVDAKAVKVARVAQEAGDSIRSISAINKSSGLIQGFTLGIDIYFNKEDTEQLKKGFETKFAKQIHKVAKQMQASLDEMLKAQTVLESADI